MKDKAEFNTKQYLYSPLVWVLFFLQLIGRATYKSAFFLLKWLYIFVYNFVSLSKQWFYLTKITSLPQYLSSQLYQLVRNFLFDFFSDLIDFRIYVVNRFNKLNQSVSDFFSHALFIPFAPSLFRWMTFLNFHVILKVLYVSTFDIRESIVSAWNWIVQVVAGVGGLFKRIPIPKIQIRLFAPSFWITSVGMIVSVLMIGSVFFYFVVLKDLPEPNQLIHRDRILTTKIFARDGSLLYKIYRNQNRSLVQLNDIPDHVVNATIAIEDKSYWTHPGFSIRGISRAIRNNLNNEEVQGGSTITQQLVKNALLSPERTYTRKLKELILAIQVEMNFSKQEILQMYFNEVPYGGVAYGIEEAAQTYFGKSVVDLNLSEAALLAGLTSAPTRFSPHGTNPEFTIYRQQQVLKRMLEEGYISQSEYLTALKTKVVIKPPVSEISSPHFTLYVKDQLVEMFGTRMVEEGGLEVYTTLDPDIQASADKAVKEEIEKLIPMRVSNGAALVTNPQTGEILAMVGSRDFFDTANDGNVNVTLQLRQPGSSIKPVTYALALQSGMTPSSMIEDTPVAYPDGFDEWGRPRMYAPVNYDNTFHGNVNLKTALASSFNIPAVKLVDRFGVDNMIDLSKKMGITTWSDRSRFGLSITLGGGEVMMTDMAVVYGVFANQGMRVDLQSILYVKDADGNLIYDFQCDPDVTFLPEAEARNVLSNDEYCQPTSVMSPLVAYQITDMLSDNNARIPAFGPNSLLNIPGHQVAVKTGTTNDKRDNWAVGYTPDRVVVVWVGNNDNTPMSAVASGITGATPIWHNIVMEMLKAESSPLRFSPPDGLVPVQVCATNGLLPCASCPVIKTEYFIPGTEPKLHCVDRPLQDTNERIKEFRN